MTTRRGFIKGALAAVGLVVLPKAAKARPENDNGGYVVPPDIADGISDRLKTVVVTDTPTVIRGSDVTVEIDGIAIDTLTITGPVPQETIDEYSEGTTVTVSPPTSRPPTFTSPFESPLATPAVPDEH